MANETVDPIQAQLIQARRNQILAAATQVFAEKGFQRATIRDIATAAGIADGTIYNYFENKTALMLGILDRLNESEQRDEDLGQIGDMDLRTFINAYLRQRFAFMTADGVEIFQVILAEVLVNPELRVLYMQRVIEPTFAVAEKHLEKMVAAKRLRAAHVSLTLRSIAAMFLGVLTLRILGDPVLESQWDELPDLLTDLILDGIAPE